MRNTFFKNKRVLLINSILLAIAMSGCRKLVDVGAPYTSTNAANVYTTNATAAAVLTGIYSRLSSLAPGLVGLQSVSYYGGMSADEFTLYPSLTSGVPFACYTNALTSANSVDIWSYTYPFIYDVNAAIEGLNASKNLSPAVKQQLLGEAMFMRAFFYFYLVNLYGGVPLILNTGYTQTAIVPRSSPSDVYKQIIQDLIQAQGLLSTNYLDATVTTTSTERTRPNQFVATALLARAYLYTGDYANAEIQASAVIGNTSMYSLNSLAKAFLKNNQEAIWQWQPVTTGYNTSDARLFVIPTTGLSSAHPVCLSQSLLNSFEPNDQRRLNWIDSVKVGSNIYYYPYKYKVNTLSPNITTSSAGMTEYTMIIRLAEVFLIRAEAEANGAGTGIGGAIADLNTVRSRASLSPYGGSTDKDSVVAAILHERQVELFSEWGHRWFDLKRTNSVDSIMGGPNGACHSKGGTWNTSWQLYPIVQTELQRNPDLSQNPGY